MANQVFGEMFSVDIGINEVMYGYFFRSISRDEIRYMIHSRANVHLIDDIRELERDWRTKFLFIRVGLNLEYPVTWSRRGGYMPWR